MGHPPRARWIVQWRRLILLICILALSVLYTSSHNNNRARHTTPDLLRRRPSRRNHFLVRQSDTLSSGIRRPPQEPRLFIDTPESLQKLVTDFEPKEASIVKQIKDIKPEDATFENAVLPYLQHEDQLKTDLAVLGLYQYVSQKPELQDTARNVSSQIGTISQKTYLDEDLFNLINMTYYKQANDTKLTNESQLVLGSFWNTFRGTGLYIEKGDERDRYQNISKELNILAGDFNQAMIDDNTTLWFTKEELNGTREDTLNSLEKGTAENEGKFKVDLQRVTDVGAIMGHCTNETTRKQITIANANQAPDNVERLKKAADLRDEQARMLGAANYATSVISSNMAKTPEAVHKLLDDVQEKVTPAARKKIEHLKELKKNETGNADHYFIWDNGYYQTVSTQREYNVDSDKVKEYFPSVPTVQAILDLYEVLFHLQFVKIEKGKDMDELSPNGKGEDLIWQEDVEMYAVWDSDSQDDYASDDGEFVGYLYLDLFQREGKTAGAFEYPIDPGFMKKDGTRHYP